MVIAWKSGESLSLSEVLLEVACTRLPEIEFHRLLQIDQGSLQQTA